ncbi:MAG TPA: WD40 repeat domain-containing protein, partial [Gemmataceae bacterium]
HGVHGLSFAPDGRTLASGGEDNVVFLWDVTGARTPAAVKKASESDLTAWWNDLASEDAKRAGAAIASLLRKSETSVAFLRQRLRLAETPDEKRLMRLLADLNSDDFETREAASRELARLGQRAEAALQQALTSQPPLEVKRRIENLLDKLEPGPLPPETLRTLRGIEVLEHLGTAEARQCLDVLAKGAPQARPTGEAKRALDRLANRR